MSHTVVVGLDDSELSARALPFAQTVARLWGGPMVLVHAIVHPGGPGATAIDASLTRLVEALRTDAIHAGALLRVTPPAHAIRHVARAQEAELIVMVNPHR